MATLERHPFSPPNAEAVVAALSRSDEQSVGFGGIGPAMEEMSAAARAVQHLVDRITQKGLVARQDETGTWRITLASLLLVALLAAPSFAATAIVTPPQYNVAAKKAAADHHRLIVLLGAKWCRFCKDVEKLAPQLRSRGHYVHVDLDAYRGWCEAAVGSKALSLPTLLIYEWDAKSEQHVRRRLITGSTAVAEVTAYVFPPEVAHDN